MTAIKKFFKLYWKFLAAGVVIGLVAIGLTIAGNPKNMGFCIACFLRDTAGGLNLHSADKVQYVRPEIIGIVLGAFVISLITKEFRSTGGSAPLTRFVLGACVMIGALIFLGCPLRMVLRIGGGDLNALIGLIGFIGGIGAGMFFLNKGFSLKRAYTLPKLEGYIAPASSGLLFILVLAVPSLFAASIAGPGSQHANIWIALLGGLIVGVIGQRVRVCFVGGIRDSMMFKQFQMLFVFGSLLVTVIIGNLITNDFNLSMSNQPVAHQEWLWNILGLFLVGFGSVLLGGCPMRQLVLSGSGNSDSSITVIGMIFGAALAHTFKLASSADSSVNGEYIKGGATNGGKIAFAVCLVIILLIAIFNTKRFFEKKKAPKVSTSEEKQTEVSAEA